jgi:ferric-dicitrate binding protein FerR (iron transport regulator)
MSNPIAAARVRLDAAMREEHRAFQKLQKAEREHDAAKEFTSMILKKLEEMCLDAGVEIGW